MEACAGYGSAPLLTGLPLPSIIALRWRKQQYTAQTLALRRTAVPDGNYWLWLDAQIVSEWSSMLRQWVASVTTNDA